MATDSGIMYYQCSFTLGQKGSFRLSRPRGTVEGFCEIVEIVFKAAAFVTGAFASFAPLLSRFRAFNKFP